MKFIIGNWKMNGNTEQKDVLLKSIKNVQTNNKIVICLPFTLLHGNDFGITIGAQDISEHTNGAYTGDISGQMLKDANIKYVIVGHSERRFYHNETNDIVKAKATTAVAYGITPIICIGETQGERNMGRTMSVIKKMLLESVPDYGEYIIAYEPRWAIGSGATPSVSEIKAIHETIFKTLRNINRENTPILYGGSVDEENAKTITSVAHVDGLLIGRASLKSDTFLPIIKLID